MQYIGVDQHKKFSYIVVMDEKGRIVKEGKVVNDREELKEFLRGCREGRAKAVIEAGPNWSVMYDWLEEEIDGVKLAHPLKVKAIADAKIKTDKIDARILAHLLRADLIPEAYVPKIETRKVKNILRQRMFFIRIQTMVKNRIQAILDRHPEVRSEFLGTDLFGKQGIEYLMHIEIPEPDKSLISESIKFLKIIREYIKKTDGLVDRLSKGDRRVDIIRTAPGMGKFFSVLVAYEIDDINRFPSVKKISSYAGLVPSTYASGNKMFHGGITKNGNKFLRWALIEAVWPAIRKDSSLRYYYQKIKERKGANAAKVAVARRLLTIIYYMLKENRGYRINYPAAPYVSVVKAR
jgi:transposase